MENAKAPLAERLRPSDFEGFYGQDDVIAATGLLRRALAAGQLPSLIFWGPPGTGKTTLARIIAAKIEAEFIIMSAVTSGVKDLKEVIKTARENEIEGKRTILFIDEIHRWNKAQQDALLPHVEKGTVILIGATTENPSFEIRSALLSRCRLVVLKPLDAAAVSAILKRALSDKISGYGELGLAMSDEAVGWLANSVNGDGRAALNALEFAVSAGSGLTVEDLKLALEKAPLYYDKDGDEHYNIISALHKSIRGSDADAALYWLARMLEAGEDPLYIARRLVRQASEDIGLANSRALEQSVAAYQACHFLGRPECNVVLAQAVVYLAKCAKSNEIYLAYQSAARDAAERGMLGVPLHLRNAPTSLMKDLGYGQDYKYSPDHDYREKQDYLPPELKGKKYLR